MLGRLARRERTRPIGPPRVLVVYPYLPHYRYGVFEELRRCGPVRYEFAADVDAHNSGIPIIPADQMTPFHRLRNTWLRGALWQSGLVRLLLTGRYDAVIFQGCAAFVSTWAGALVCRLRRTRVLYWTIGWHRPDRGGRRLTRLAFYRLAHGLLLYGQVGRRIGRAMGYPDHRMTVIGNSLRSSVEENGEGSAAGEGRAAALAELAALLPAPGTDAVAAVIRQNAYKRLDLLLHAAARLAGRGRPITVVLAGGGPEHDNLRRLANELGVDLRLLGPVYGERQLRLIYERTRLTVVPKFAGLTAVQSLSYGRPVVTSDNEYEQMPESECIRPGATGGHYRDDSVDSLADVIADWLDRMRDGEQVIADACREELRERWSPQRHAAAIDAAVRRHLDPADRHPDQRPRTEAPDGRVLTG
jgi:glycosyltransferase involved in cell wall biosynthesis